MSPTPIIQIKTHLGGFETVEVYARPEVRRGLSLDAFRLAAANLLSNSVTIEALKGHWREWAAAEGLDVAFYDQPNHGDPLAERFVVAIFERGQLKALGLEQ